jgi:hypothetical protein
MSCPDCGARLVGRHRWFYYPALVSAWLLLFVPIALLGFRFDDSMVMMMATATVSWLLVLPFDRYLDDRFAVLTPMVKEEAPTNKAPSEPETDVEEAAEEEQS